MGLKKSVYKLINKVVAGAMGTDLSQLQTEPSGEPYITEGLSALARQAAAEGVVLLKNDGVLPLARGTRVSLFGRCFYDGFYVGYGSGGDVKPPYTVTFIDGAKGAERAGRIRLDRETERAYLQWRADKRNAPDDGFWGHRPHCYREMSVGAELARAAAARSDVALVLIGRAAGEDDDSFNAPGGYLPTAEEVQMLCAVTAAFAKTVVLFDCGGVQDLSFLQPFGEKIAAVAFTFFGGMEAGGALFDVLTGEVSPCGKLADTVAAAYTDYPSAQHFGGKAYSEYAEDIFVGYRYFETFAKEKVLYPFGFGLSYTAFSLDVCAFSARGDAFEAEAHVKNIGGRAGKEVVQLYCAPPQGALGKPARVLVAFAKTRELAAGEEEELLLRFRARDFASFDDTGAVARNAWVLEAGEYRFYAGNSVRADRLAGTYTLAAPRVLAQTSGACAPATPFLRLCAREKDGAVVPVREDVPTGGYDEKARILAQLPAEIAQTGQRGHSFADYAAGRVSAEEFLAQLTDGELEALTRGFGCMNAPLGVSGNAGAFGGVVPALAARGVPAAVTADGPAGLRLNRYCALLPCGTALACSWNTPLVRSLFAKLGEEAAHYGVDVWLGPGMNIHRDPLCGRNFEYYSEDPLLTGRMAAAAVQGVQSRGRAACPKHFACNNQERRRNKNDSRVSARALREIYLRGFEICVEEGDPLCVMTSYNKVNGEWAHYHFGLVTDILRGDWGYTHLVITDWWMRRAESPHFAGVKDNAYRVRAQVDVLMPGNRGHLRKKYISDGTLLRRLNGRGGITRAEVQRSAGNTLRFLKELYAARQAEEKERH